MGTNDDSTRERRAGGVDDVFAAVDAVTGAARKVGGEASAFGPLPRGGVSRSVGISTAVFLTLFFAARILLELDTLATPLRVLIALLPLPAFVWFLWSFVQSVSDADELERRIQLEALAFAFPLTILLVMTLGLLQIAVPLSPDDWSYRHIWPLIYVFYILGLTRARRRYI
jgi:hypothetical protein